MMSRTVGHQAKYYIQKLPISMPQRGRPVVWAVKQRTKWFWCKLLKRDLDGSDDQQVLQVVIVAEAAVLQNNLL